VILSFTPHLFTGEPNIFSIWSSLNSALKPNLFIPRM
jgi:hypothetical protein